MFHQTYNPAYGSLLVSSLLAALPLASMFLMLGWLRISPHLSDRKSVV